jgi:hypothetical protein
MSVGYAILQTTTKKRIKKIMNKTYQVGDLFTTTKSKVTGTINKIEQVTPSTTRLGLTMEDGSIRWTSVKLG